MDHVFISLSRYVLEIAMPAGPGEVACREEVAVVKDFLSATRLQRVMAMINVTHQKLVSNS